MAPWYQPIDGYYLWARDANSMDPGSADRVSGRVTSPRTNEAGTGPGRGVVAEIRKLPRRAAM